ncbi:MAG: hypothetical protein AB7K09_21495 [Planctomycetota bacterium]
MRTANACVATVMITLTIALTAHTASAQVSIPPTFNLPPETTEATAIGLGVMVTGAVAVEAARLLFTGTQVLDGGPAWNFNPAPFTANGLTSPHGLRPVLGVMDVGLRCEEFGLAGLRVGATAMFNVHVAGSVDLSASPGRPGSDRAGEDQLTAHFTWGWQFYFSPEAWTDIGVSLGLLDSSKGLVVGPGFYGRVRVVVPRMLNVSAHVQTNVYPVKRVAIEGELTIGHLVGIGELRIGVWFACIMHEWSRVGPTLAYTFWI